MIIHGALKAAYLGKLMTDWLGDPGALRSLQCQHRGMDFPSESVICKGRVTRKYVEDGQSLADCEISIENSSGQTTAPGPGNHISPVIMTYPNRQHIAIRAIMSFKQEPDHWILK